VALILKIGHVFAHLLFGIEVHGEVTQPGEVRESCREERGLERQDEGEWLSREKRSELHYTSPLETNSPNSQ
jgi:hypothetical protein